VRVVVSVRKVHRRGVVGRHVRHVGTADKHLVLLALVLLVLLELLLFRVKRVAVHLELLHLAHVVLLHLLEVVIIVEILRLHLWGSHWALVHW